jgi:hypothetical protein
MLSVEDVASLSERQRAEVLAALLRLKMSPVVPKLLWQRRLFIVVTMSVAAAVLTGWIGYLMLTLPDKQSAGWRVAWLGFDVAELGLYLVTAWAAWRYRRILVSALFASAILLLCDAWFDIALSWRTGGWWTSLLLGFGVEVPLACVLVLTARQIRRSIEAAVRAAIGLDGEPPKGASLLDPLLLSRKVMG